MNKIKFFITIAVLSLSTHIVTAQTKSQNTILEKLNEATLDEQFSTLEDRTIIYDNFRALREDYFQLLKKNSLDSLNKGKKKINELNVEINNLNTKISNLNTELSTAISNYEHAVETKDTLSFLGIKMNKKFYNLTVWFIIIALLVLFVLFMIVFKTNKATTKSAKKELEAIQAEYAEYKKKTRLEREKMTMEHFREIQKLKGI